MVYSKINFRRLSLYGLIFFLVLWPLVFWLSAYPFDAYFWFLYLFFGVGVGVVTLLITYNATASGPSIVSSKTLEVPEQELGLVLDKLLAQKNWKLKTASRERYVLETPVSWSSLGEIITITREKGLLTIESTPKISATVVDYGKNHKNIRDIMQIIKETS